MLTIPPNASTLLVVDFQTRLMPAIDRGPSVVANARRLLDAAALLGVPCRFTEQNVQGLGPTVPELAPAFAAVTHKMTFDACREPGFLECLPANHAIVVAGCEAHVCVLQTVLGLIDHGRQIFLVRDAIGSRLSESRETAIRRAERHGAEIVTTEMVVFEWLGTAKHDRFRDVLKLIR